MGRRSVAAAGESSDAPPIVAGDVIWAPYRKAAWPSVVSAVYPKKITYVFLPLPEENQTKGPVFSSPSNKIHLFSTEDVLPEKAKDDFVDAFEAAMEIAKARSQTGVRRHGSSVSSVGGSSERNGGTKRPRKKSETEEVKLPRKGEAPSLSGDGSEGTGSASTAVNLPPTLNDIVWLSSAGHPDWPVMVRKSMKKRVWVDSFPMTGKLEQYLWGACMQFDLKDKALDAAIKKERNLELKEALKSVQQYRAEDKKVKQHPDEATTDQKGAKTKKPLARSHKQTTEKRLAQSQNETPMANSQEKKQLERSQNEAAEKREEEPEEANETSADEMMVEPESESNGVKPLDMLLSNVLDVNEVMNSSTASLQAMAGSPTDSEGSKKGKRTLRDVKGSSKSKKGKFSQELEAIEKELASKLEEMKKGDIAWVEVGPDGGADKWPIYVLSVDKDAKTCNYVHLPIDSEISISEERQASVRLVDVSLYDTVSTNQDDVTDGVLKAAIEQADLIVRGELQPFDDVDSTMVEGKKHAVEENGWSEKNLDAEKIVEYCQSEECRTHVESVWNGTETTDRQKKYQTPICTPCNLNFRAGSLVDEETLGDLVEVINGWIKKLEPEKNSVLLRLHYIAQVALPEALIFAISEVLECSMTEAEPILNQALKNQDQNSERVEHKTVSPNAKSAKSAPMQQLLRAVMNARNATSKSD